MSMSEDEQRIALCQAMGWKCIQSGPNGYPIGINQEPDVFRPLPDTNSLDVLHGFEMKLTQDQQITYTVELWRVVNGVLPAIGSAPYLGHFASATAAQRREALCRVLGLHKDSKP
jgi:hypothetical protein